MEKNKQSCGIVSLSREDIERIINKVKDIYPNDTREEIVKKVSLWHQYNKFNNQNIIDRRTYQRLPKELYTKSNIAKNDGSVFKNTSAETKLEILDNAISILKPFVEMEYSADQVGKKSLYERLNGVLKNKSVQRAALFLGVEIPEENPFETKLTEDLKRGSEIKFDIKNKNKVTEETNAIKDLGLFLKNVIGDNKDVNFLKNKSYYDNQDELKESVNKVLELEKYETEKKLNEKRDLIKHIDESYLNGEELILDDVNKFKKDKTRIEFLMREGIIELDKDSFLSKGIFEKDMFEVYFSDPNSELSDVFKLSDKWKGKELSISEIINAFKDSSSRSVINDMSNTKIAESEIRRAIEKAKSKEKSNSKTLMDASIMAVEYAANHISNKMNNPSSATKSEHWPKYIGDYFVKKGYLKLDANGKVIRKEVIRGGKKLPVPDVTIPESDLKTFKQDVIKEIIRDKAKIKNVPYVSPDIKNKLNLIKDQLTSNELLKIQTLIKASNDNINYLKSIKENLSEINTMSKTLNEIIIKSNLDNNTKIANEDLKKIEQEYSRYIQAKDVKNKIELKNAINIFKDIIENRLNYSEEDFGNITKMQKAIKEMSLETGIPFIDANEFSIKNIEEAIINAKENGSKYIIDSNHENNIVKINYIYSDSLIKEVIRYDLNDKIISMNEDELKEIASKDVLFNKKEAKSADGLKYIKRFYDKINKKYDVSKNNSLKIEQNIEKMNKNHLKLLEQVSPDLIKYNTLLVKKDSTKLNEFLEIQDAVEVFKSRRFDRLLSPEIEKEYKTIKRRIRKRIGGYKYITTHDTQYGKRIKLVSDNSAFDMYIDKDKDGKFIYRQSINEGKLSEKAYIDEGSFLHKNIKNIYEMLGNNNIKNEREIKEINELNDSITSVISEKIYNKVYDEIAKNSIDKKDFIRTIIINSNFTGTDSRVFGDLLKYISKNKNIESTKKLANVLQKISYMFTGSFNNLDKIQTTEYDRVKLFADSLDVSYVGGGDKVNYEDYKDTIMANGLERIINEDKKYKSNNKWISETISPIKEKVEKLKEQIKEEETIQEEEAVHKERLTRDILKLYKEKNSLIKQNEIYSLKENSESKYSDDEFKQAKETIGIIEKEIDEKEKEIYLLKGNEEKINSLKNTIKELNSKIGIILTSKTPERFKYIVNEINNISDEGRYFESTQAISPSGKTIADYKGYTRNADEQFEGEHDIKEDVEENQDDQIQTTAGEDELSVGQFDLLKEGTEAIHYDDLFGNSREGKVKNLDDINPNDTGVISQIVRRFDAINKSEYTLKDSVDGEIKKNYDINDAEQVEELLSKKKSMNNYGETFTNDIETIFNGLVPRLSPEIIAGYGEDNVVEKQLAHESLLIDADPDVKITDETKDNKQECN